MAGEKLRYHRAWNASNEELEPEYSYFNARPSGCIQGGHFCFFNSGIGWWAFPDIRFNDREFLAIAHWLYENEPQLGWKPFSRRDGFYVRCLKEGLKSIRLYFDDDLEVVITGITLKYSQDATFQDLLNLVYIKYLKKKVRPKSYGRQWIIEEYDGERLEIAPKTNINDSRKIEDVFRDLRYSLSKTIYIVKNRW